MPAALLSCCSAEWAEQVRVMLHGEIERVLSPAACLGLPLARLGLPSARLGLPSARLGLPLARLGLPIAAGGAIADVWVTACWGGQGQVRGLEEARKCYEDPYYGGCADSLV